MTREEFEQSMQRLKEKQAQKVKDSGAPEVCTCKRCNKEFSPFYYQEPWDCQNCRGNGYVESALEDWEVGSGYIDCNACDGRGVQEWVEQRECPSCVELGELEMGYDRDDNDDDYPDYHPSELA